MTVTITVRNNGPLVIAADQVSMVTLVDHEGNVIPPRSAEGKPMSLCRCVLGNARSISANKSDRLMRAVAERLYR